MSLPLSDNTDATIDATIEKIDSVRDTDQVDQPSSTPPSSPPVVKEEPSQTVVSSLSKESSLETMAADSDKAVDSSLTVTEEHFSTAPEGKPTVTDNESSATNPPSMNAHSMLPPSVPASKNVPVSKKRPHSGSSSSKSQSQPEEPQKAAPNSSQTLNTSSSAHDSNGGDDESRGSSVSGEADEQIEDFDWRSLEERYHDRMRELDSEQQAIMNEFGGLCEYFGIWAQAGSRREIERSYKRLKTQSTLVQHHEDQLEQKREHYIKVVEAFKSALQLLAK